MKPDRLADVQGADDDHLFDDAPQGVGATQAVQPAKQDPALAQQTAPQGDEHLFDDAPQGIAEPPGHEHALGATKDAARAFNKFPQGITEQDAQFAAIHVACSAAGP
jgi:hypothetical protein